MNQVYRIPFMMIDKTRINLQIIPFFLTVKSHFLRAFNLLRIRSQSQFLNFRNYRCKKQKKKGGEVLMLRCTARTDSTQMLFTDGQHEQNKISITLDANNQLLSRPRRLPAPLSQISFSLTSYLPHLDPNDSHGEREN